MEIATKLIEGGKIDAEDIENIVCLRWQFLVRIEVKSSLLETNYPVSACLHK